MLDVVVEIEEEQPLITPTSVQVVVAETVRVEEIDVDAGGIKGDPGPPGPPGATDAVVLTATAGQVLSGHRVVVNDAGTLVYADPTNPMHAALAPMLTTGAAAAGDTIQALVLGPLEESTWSWTPRQRLYIGAAGVLTTTPPTGAWMRVVGSTSDATHIFFDPHPPIVLSN